MKKLFKHLINKIAFVWFYLTKGSFLSSFAYGYDDRTVTVSLPGTRFAELLCERDGFRPIRFAVGQLDAGTEILRIDTGVIAFRCGEQKWESSITEFLKGLHFSRA